VCATDIYRFTDNDDLGRDELLTAHADVLDEAAAHASLHRETWVRQTTGDGELSILPDSEPESRVVDDFVRALHAALVRYNEPRLPTAWLRVRLAIAYGVVDPATFAGFGVITACRLVDSGPVRAVLTATSAPLAVILSDRVFTDTVAQRRSSLRPADFQSVRATRKNFTQDAWVMAPDVDIRSLDLDCAPDSGADRAPADAAGRRSRRGPGNDSPRQSDIPNRPGLEQTFNGDIDAPYGVFGVVNNW
jgi:hypothetical protein